MKVRHAHSRQPLLSLVAASLLALSPIAAEATAEPRRAPGSAYAQVRHQTLRVGELDVFYREAGPPDAPVLLLLHGFPTSSFMFRDLIPRLADRYRIIAPDYPGFGQSSFPSRASFRYSFENLTNVIDGFTQALGLRRYALYVQDYGAPIGLRLALEHPERVTALVVQNGNAYEVGLDERAWRPLRAYWREPTAERRERLRMWLTPAGIKQQYVDGLSRAQAAWVSPDTWTLDWAGLSRPENAEAQLDLFGDYGNNVALYPQFQGYFRKHHPPTLIVWGTRDPFFTRAGASAYRRDLPDAELVWLDAGHFALETHAADIATHMRDFLGRKLR